LKLGKDFDGFEIEVRGQWSVVSGQIRHWGKKKWSSRSQ